MEERYRPAPMTPEEQARFVRVIEEIQRSHAEQLARRRGKLFPPSWELIDEIRDERTRELS